MELIGRECFQDRENGKRYFGKIAMVKFERDLKNRLIEVWYVDFEDGRAVAPSYRFRLWAA